MVSGEVEFSQASHFGEEVWRNDAGEIVSLEVKSTESGEAGEGVRERTGEGVSGKGNGSETRELFERNEIELAGKAETFKTKAGDEAFLAKDSGPCSIGITRRRVWEP